MSEKKNRYTINQWIAKSVIEERLSIPATARNIDVLANCISELESTYRKEA